mmetsp:Transcript_15049/g.33123  ORF Transcript_15049/g.33123 Transcript_15049/m.33123 type:complete len:869 (+) Transcript_15049:146-2752(+)
MSTDRKALAALSKSAGSELRYFELVALRFSGESQDVFLCIGKHALYLLRRNLGGLYPDAEGGEIYYAHVKELVEDSQSSGDLLIILGTNRSSTWRSEKLFIVSEHRRRLVDRLTVAWQTDYLYRYGHAKGLPRRQQPLRSKPQDGLLRVRPFKGYKEVVHKGYVLFMPESYVEGETEGTFMDRDRNLMLTVLISEPVCLLELEKYDREHVRWVAMEYKQHAVEHLRRANPFSTQSLDNAQAMETNFVAVNRDAFYLKRMNLANDIACWTAWELCLQADAGLQITILLRRGFVPPLMDAMQDMAITLRCPAALIGTVFTEARLLEELRLVADSVSPLVRDCTCGQTLYGDIIQAKLDALLFSEDSLRWFDKFLGRRPVHEGEARVFVKSILKLLQDENALHAPDTLNAIGEHIHPVQEPLSVPEQMFRRLPFSEEAQDTSHSWKARVARYFAYSLDGGILGSQFTLHDLAAPSLLTKQSQQRVADVLHFLLHIRPKDMSLPFSWTTIEQLLHEPNFRDYSFNDRVMQALLEFGWISRRLARAEKGHGRVTSRGEPGMSIELAKLLALLLLADVSSTSLKAAICRQIMSSARSQERFPVLVPALMETLRSSNNYLKTYATVTLVNMSGGQGPLKNALMRLGVAPLCIQHLTAKDDDLTRYTLALLTNVTKSVHHRQILRDHGVIPILMDLLFRHHTPPFKHQVLSELVSVIGQLCNDQAAWSVICEPGWLVVVRLMQVFHGAQPGTRLRSKTMFALKQLCAQPESGKNRLRVGEAIPSIIAELSEAAQTAGAAGEGPPAIDLDCATNAILLLLALSLSWENCLVMQRCGSEDVLSQLMSTRLGEMDSTRDRIHQLMARVSANAHDGQTTL